MTAILLHVRWCLLVLVCISLTTNGVQHFLMCCLDICAFSLEQCLFGSFDRFSVRLSFYS